MADRLLVTFISALALAVIIVLPNSALAAFPGKSGKIAFVSGSYSGESSIYTINADGSALTKLPDTGLANRGPKWSPDGKKIVFYTNTARYTDGKTEIWTMNADGTGKNRLTDNAVEDTLPTWSPDGKRIAFTRYLPGAGDTIHVMNSDGTDQRTLPGGEGAYSPAWSPDGEQIAFFKYGRYHELSYVAIAPADGSGEVKALPLGGVFGVSWSADSERLALTTVPVFVYWPGMIVIANSDGSAAKIISPSTSYPGGPLSDSQPAWSPEGDKIVFSGCEPCIFDNGVPSHITTMNPDGTARTVISSDVGPIINDPDWQPISGPNRSDYKSEPAFCRAEQDFWGESKFTERYGGGRNAFGKCVSRRPQASLPPV